MHRAASLRAQDTYLPYTRGLISACPHPSAFDSYMCMYTVLAPYTTPIRKTRPETLAYEVYPIEQEVMILAMCSCILLQLESTAVFLTTMASNR